MSDFQILCLSGGCEMAFQCACVCVIVSFTALARYNWCTTNHIFKVTILWVQPEPQSRWWTYRHAPHSSFLWWQMRWSTFTCSLDIRILLLPWAHTSLLPFFLLSFLSLLWLTCRSSLCILNTSPSSVICFANIFSFSVACLFTL